MQRKLPELKFLLKYRYLGRYSKSVCVVKWVFYGVKLLCRYSQIQFTSHLETNYFDFE